MKNLRRYRKLRFMTQVDLAKSVGVSVQTIGAWESGTSEPRPSKLRKLCEVLNVSPEKLLGEEEDEASQHEAA